jgi:predicted hydrocarbon binding protein
MNSGMFYPNRFVRLTLQSMEDVVGSSGMKAVYNLSGLTNLAGGLPPDDMERQFAYGDFSKLFEILGSLFGPNGARSLAIRAGKSTMQEGIKVFSGTLPPLPEQGPDETTEQHMLVRLNRFSNFLNSVTDQQTSLVRLENSQGFIFKTHQCPVCWGRTSTSPVCAFFEGMLDHAAEAFSGTHNYTVVETTCIAAGSEDCLFTIQKIQPEPSQEPL